jgi:TonB-dependent receptor
MFFMKKLILLLSTIMPALIGFSQSAAESALLKGSISDAANRSKLAGASVRISGTTNGTVADLNGQFTLYCPPGNASVVISFLGYRDTTLQVTLQQNQVTTLTVSLSSGVAQLGNVLITGFLQGQAKALTQQKNADNIRNIISSDQIGRFPDPNAAEALQRVPGVNIERDQGEGRYVLIRGLAPQFTNININGEQIPSPEADVRFVALDAIPSDQLASIEVSKTLTPDMDGDAVGGSVNLITRTAQNKYTHINGSLAGGYNNLTGKPNVQGQLQFDQRFGAKEKLGIMINGNYYHNHLASDNWEYAPSDNELELRDYELVRTRTGLSSTIDYKFNDRHEIYFRSIYSRFTDREWRRRYVFIPEDDEIEKLTKDRFEAQSIASFNLGGKHNFRKFYLNYEGQYSQGRQNTPYDHEVGFIAGVPSSFDVTGGKYPALNAAGFNDNSNYEFDEVAYGHTLAKDRNITAKFEIGIPYKTGRSSGTIKFGGKTRFKKKSYTINSEAYGSDGGVPNANEFDEDPIKDNGTILGGRFNMGRPVNVSSFNRFFNQNPGLFELDVESKSIDEALESFQAEENVYAAFLMARHQLKKVLLVGGLRYERTNVKYNSKDVVIDPAGDLQEIIPVSGSSNYDFLLPQVQARFELGKMTNLRASATYSYARPNFSEIIPAQEINREDEVATIGNANLKPTKALNLDLMLEHYFGNVGIVSAGIFHKKLDDFIYRRVLFNSPYPLTGTPIIPAIDVIQAQNGNDANLTGVELAFQRKLDFLPGFLNKFSLYTNYTYTHSKANLQSRTADPTKPNEIESLRLPGQATHVGNIALAFESKKLLVRLAANFNGEYLSEIGGEPAEDLYVKSRMQLDLSASYVINPRFRLFAEGLNLTNQPFESYMGSKNVISQREFYSWWMRFGLKFDLHAKK